MQRFSLSSLVTWRLVKVVRPSACICYSKICLKTVVGEGSSDMKYLRKDLWHLCSSINRDEHLSFFQVLVANISSCFPIFYVSRIFLCWEMKAIFQPLGYQVPGNMGTCLSNRPKIFKLHKVTQFIILKR